MHKERMRSFSAGIKELFSMPLPPIGHARISHPASAERKAGRGMPRFAKARAIAIAALLEAS
jgi:hypothetical protein